MTEVSTQDKLKAVAEDIAAGMSIEKACKKNNLSKVTYYKHKSGKSEKKVTRVKKEVKLEVSNQNGNNVRITDKIKQLEKEIESLTKLHDLQMKSIMMAQTGLSEHITKLHTMICDI